jgi:FK506-binding nuclear protein
VVKPGQAVSILPQGDLVITNAALGAELADPIGRTSVKLTYIRPVKVTDDDEDEEEKDEDDDDEIAQVETVLCSFTPEKVPHAIPWRVNLRD